MKKLLKKWQSILGLTDWVIDLRDNCAPDDFILKNVNGECEYNEMLKCAVIRLLDEKYYEKRVLPYDKEKTLIHELLHIKFSFLQESGNDLQERIVHQLIDDLAKSFIVVKKSKETNNGKS